MVKKLKLNPDTNPIKNFQFYDLFLNFKWKLKEDEVEEKINLSMRESMKEKAGSKRPIAQTKIGEL